MEQNTLFLLPIKYPNNTELHNDSLNSNGRLQRDQWSSSQAATNDKKCADKLDTYHILIF